MMRAAQISGFGDIHSTLCITRVCMPGAPSASEVQIRVHAVSLSPSDYRMSTGAVSLLKRPSRFPYIPCGDVCGTVHAAGCASGLRVGERVVGTWEGFGVGGLAEYTNVDKRYVQRLPTGFSFAQGAAMADSAANGMLATEDAQIKNGDRVLVLGGSGAVGNVVVQLAKRNGAYVLATSTREELVAALGADCVVDYTGERWWQREELAAGVDVVVDCAEGEQAWRRVVQHGLLKKNGRFLAVVWNEWHIEIRGWMEFVKWGARVVRRIVQAWWLGYRYRVMLPAQRGDSMKRCFDLVGSGVIKIVLDENGPWKFEEEAVKNAWDVMTSRRAHGKVVIQVVEEEDSAQQRLQS